MKKIFLIFVTMIANQAFATDLTGSSASCDSGVLGIESGNIALRAEYEPESIELRWYDDTGKQIAVTSEYASCTYNEPITIPTAPTKTGYKFAGWKVRPRYDFSTIDEENNYATNGLHKYSRGVHKESNADICRGDGSAINCSSLNFNRHQWKTIFSYGTIYGDAMCSTTIGIDATAGNPTNDGGGHCWCKVIAYKNGDIWYSPSNNLSWVYQPGYSSEQNCSFACSSTCSKSVMDRVGFRRAVFGVN